MARSKSTRCYEGDHMLPAVVSWVGIFLFVIGFPVSLLWSLIRNKTNIARDIKFGYLLRNLKPPFFWFRSVWLLFPLLVALTESLAIDKVATVFVSALVVLVQRVVVVAYLRPFEKVRQNIEQPVIATIVVSMSAYVLRTTSTSSSSSSSQLANRLFSALLAAFGIVMVGSLVLMLCCRARRQGKRVSRNVVEETELTQFTGTLQLFGAANPVPGQEEGDDENLSLLPSAWPPVDRPSVVWRPPPPLPSTEGPAVVQPRLPPVPSTAVVQTRLPPVPSIQTPAVIWRPVPPLPVPSSQEPASPDPSIPQVPARKVNTISQQPSV